MLIHSPDYRRVLKLGPASGRLADNVGYEQLVHAVRGVAQFRQDLPAVLPGGQGTLPTIKKVSGIKVQLLGGWLNLG